MTYMLYDFLKCPIPPFLTPLFRSPDKRTTPAANPKVAPPPAVPTSVVDSPGPQLTRPSSDRPAAYNPILGKGSVRPPVPPIPSPSIGKAAPTHVPAVDPGLNRPRLHWEFNNQRPPGIARGRIGGEHTRSDWFDANPEWRTIGRSPKDDGHTALAAARRPFSNDPNHALQRILDLRARGRHVGVEPA